MYKKNQVRTLIIGVFIGLVFLIADQTSVHFFKDVFQRLRPCHNPNLEGLVHILNGKCGGQYGFVSSHAANSFAIATFAGLVLRKYHKYILTILLFWAALVAYSRVYVGVHYPADIIVGGALGIIVGIFVFWLMKTANNKFNLQIDNFK